MKFRSLKIEAVQYGADKGKIVAEIAINGDKSTTTMVLPDDVADRILKLAKDAIIDGVEKAANDFIFEITTAIPDTLLIG
jgi:hypothetical protein